MKRTDRPDPPQSGLDVGTGIARAGKVSGPALERVRPGWFLPIGDCDKAHWFDTATTEGKRRMRRLCDGELIPPGMLYEPGTWPSCRRCLAEIRGSKGAK